MKKDEKLFAPCEPFEFRCGISNLYVYREFQIIGSLIVNDQLDYFRRLHNFNKRYLKSKKKEKSDI